MTKEPPKNTKTKVALTLAQGVSVTARACAYEAPKATAYKRASDPESPQPGRALFLKTLPLTATYCHFWSSSQTSLETLARAYPQSNLGTLAKAAVDARKRAASSDAYTP